MASNGDAFGNTAPAPGQGGGVRLRSHDFGNAAGRAYGEDDAGESPGVSCGSDALA